MFVGWDWASGTHDVTVLDKEGQIVDRWSLRHDAAGIDATLERLAGHGAPETLPVAIETTTGLVVDRLLAVGHPVVPIHPNAFNAARPRWGAARAKSDPGDSYRLADYLRTDGHRLRRLEPIDPVTVQIQALSRMRSDHVEAKVAATNQLAALLERLRSAPEPTFALAPDTLTELVHAQVRLLRTLLATIADLDRAMGALLLEHTKAQLLAPMPRIGEVNLAQIIGELGPILDRALDVEHACAEAGAAPVTKESGTSRAVNFRWAANTRARQALSIFADNSRHASPWAAQLYADARRRGKRHPHAIRILMRAWLRVIWACWHTNTTYNPTLHGAEHKLAQKAAA